ncbi:gamma-butyrobetaine hydroxylase-like domain-containing protein [Pseudoroseomonas globiformis]|uniref:Gamma-butyrobetaine hydroxylase-like domain-containing protein n=1 Tax=Teichococcus globiformis TaxID=2307229 RepID=A0ABV7FTU2_9PROT
MPLPTDIRLRRAERVLELRFDDGAAFALPAEYLRVESPSAEDRGHGEAPRRLVSGRREVGILEIEPIGNYAIRLIFDDLHDTGIYTWDYLYQLGREQSVRWAAYEAALAGRGLSRDPRHGAARPAP